MINDKNAVITPADMATRDYAYNTNWYEEMIKNAPITQSNINISGGTDKVSYFISAGHFTGIFGAISFILRAISYEADLG